MSGKLEIKNDSQAVGIELSLSSMQTHDTVKIIIPPNDSFITKIVKEGVRKLHVSISGEKYNFWEGIIPVNISDSISINPDNKSVIYKDNPLVNILKPEESNTFLILTVLAIIIVVCFLLYKSRMR